MDAQIVAKMRARIEQCRRLADTITDPRAARILLQMAEEGEADLARMQADEEASKPKS